MMYAGCFLPLFGVVDGGFLPLYSAIAAAAAFASSGTYL